MLVRDICHGADVQCIQAWVADGLSVERFGSLIDGGAEVVRVAAIDETYGNAELGEGIVEEIIGAPIEAGRCNDFIARSSNVEDSQRFRRLPRRCSQCPDAPFQGGDTTLKGILSGVHDTCIDVSELFECEEIRRVLRAI